MTSICIRDIMLKKVFLLAVTWSLLLKGNCSDIYKTLYKHSLIPQKTELRKRVLTTICCDDCAHLPKVENAGQVVQTDNTEQYQLMHNGIKIVKDCYYGAWMTTLIQLSHGHHEPQEEKAFFEVLKHLPPNAVMIELGSYWGFYSMWFQQEIPGARNFLIEPDPKNIEIGKRNFALNNMHGNFTQAMLAEKSESETLFTDWDYNKHTVPAVCIDDFARQHNIDFIHILHSDIQGAEIDMLKGCSRLIAEKKIGYFFISTHRGVHEACLALLKNADLEILVSVTREQSFSADGLIVAKLKGIPGPTHINITKRSDSFCTLINEVVNE